MFYFLPMNSNDIKPTRKRIPKSPAVAEESIARILSGCRINSQDSGFRFWPDHCGCQREARFDLRSKN